MSTINSSHYTPPLWWGDGLAGAWRTRIDAADTGATRVNDVALSAVA
ncbi:hypothetical protein [Corynebacterium aquilae]|nr:hypothetical protein [Corynebacterium aquilae]